MRIPISYPRAQRALRALVAAAASCAASACMEQPAEHSAEPGVTEQAIISGTTVAAEHSGVVVLEDLDGAKYCTGTLMTNRLVLTAKHCIVNAGNGGAAAWPRLDFGGGGILDNRATPGNIYVRMGAQRIRASAVKVWATDKPANLTEDVAVIKLESAMSMKRNIAPNIGTVATTGFQRQYYGGTIQNLNGKQLTCFGYGRNTQDQASLDGTLRKARMTAAYVPEGNGTGAAIRTDANASGQIQSHGDSGGPCFIGTDPATEAVVTVLSTGDYCSLTKAWSDAWTDYQLWYYETAASI